MYSTYPHILPALLLGPALIFAAAYDLKYQKIPNLLNFSLAGLAIILHSTFSGLEGLWFSIVGMLLGTAIFLPIYIFRGMGAGDAKLMGAVGAVLGAEGVFVSAVLTALFGGVYALLLLAVHRRYGRELLARIWAVLKTFVLIRQYVPLAGPNPVQDKPRLCYGVAIALGTSSYLLLEYMGVQVIGA